MAALGEACSEDDNIEDKRERFRRLLHTRFGGIPESVERRIDAANATQLDGLIDRAITVQHVEAL